MTRSHKGILLAAVPAGLSAISALAQTSQGRISGRLLDPGSAVIPGAEVVAANEAAGEVETTEVLSIDLPLQLGDLTETISVAAEAPGAGPRPAGRPRIEGLDI